MPLDPVPVIFLKRKNQNLFFLCRSSKNRSVLSIFTLSPHSSDFFLNILASDCYRIWSLFLYFGERRLPIFFKCRLVSRLLLMALMTSDASALQSSPHHVAEQCHFPSHCLLCSVSLESVPFTVFFAPVVFPPGSTEPRFRTRAPSPADFSSRRDGIAPILGRARAQ
jgi:hypothetical protein